MAAPTTTEQSKSPEQAKPPVARLHEKYKKEIVPALQKQFGYGNLFQVPRLTKIVVSMGVGKAIENKTRIEHAVRDLSTVCGQRAVVTRARNAISSFRLRQGMPIGAVVTLRGPRMYEFLDRLVTIVVPRIRDFRGLNRKLDGRGSYSMGLSEQTVFPEINLDKIEFVQGMNITMVTSAKTDAEGQALLEQFGVPFRK